MFEVISSDRKIQEYINSISSRNNLQNHFIDTELDSCEMLSNICSIPLNLLVIDNDSLKFKADKFIINIRKLCPDSEIIFITSDNSVELGRKISPLGIQYYAVKPVSEMELDEAINAILTNRNKTLTEGGS